MRYKKLSIFKICFAVSFFYFLLLPANISVTYAASLTSVSDFISTSISATTSTHTLQFTATNAIPLSGKIVITPQSGAFTIPPAFDYTDVDFAVATTGSFTDRSLALIPSGTEDGILVVSGTSGSITVTLNSSQGIGQGDDVQIELGDNATFGVVGDELFVNPQTVGSYRVSVATYDQLDVPIDNAKAMIAVVNPVTINVGILAQAPILSNGFPSGQIAAGNDVVELSVNTNEASNCRYATTTPVVYESMTNTFSSTGGTLHTTVVTNLQDGTSYIYYVRCIDTSDNANLTDFPISFSLKSTPSGTSSGGTSSGSGTSNTGGGSGSGGRGGVGAFLGGSQFLYRASVSLQGWSSPLSVITILKDGEEESVIQSNNEGVFENSVRNLERGTYTFVVYALDSKKRKSASFSSTLSLGQGSNNAISNIVTPPTIELQKDTVPIGEKVFVFGESVPGSTIEFFVKRQSNVFSVGDAKRFTASSTRGVPNIPDGFWEVSFDTTSFTKGTYEVQARSILSEQAESDFSRVLFLGIGEEPSPDFSLRADINKDGKVNLVDFSILLVHWNTSDADSDINSDGIVGLSDFSIILFYWTG